MTAPQARALAKWGFRGTEETEAAIWEENTTPELLALAGAFRGNSTRSTDGVHGGVQS